MYLHISIPSKENTALSDEEIVYRIQSGKIPKANGVEVLVTRRAPLLWRHLSRKYEFDADQLGDVIAETILTIWEKLERYDPDRGQFMSWVFGIAHNKAHEAFRQMNRQPTTPIFDSKPRADANLNEDPILCEEDMEQQLDQKAFETKVLEQLMTFCDLDRTLFLLKGNYDLTYEELSRILNKAGYKTTPESIAQRLHRMRKKLKTSLARELTMT